ncbi:IclR family transcriptional regulator [Brachybacterium aquaticum]|uniref:DNA-binding IclR family transcriptional regulator n=1 Tax=Brachybacterium aquaticum TaxID=1432564 RepID=A0A841ACD1_9MICO|nr:IclR family transcriptional regulator [Brachybacterium aquaticum]MBB5830768.1 DNA-binding IclR family transcriptional regulator [Brachybacterium aquaticum]
MTSTKDSDVRVGESGQPGQPGQIGRAIAVLEAVAEHGSSTARGIADATGIPLPTVYRLAQELIRAGYLVHLRGEKRFALGYGLHRLAVGLHQDLGVPRAVREEIHAMHRDLGMASYLAIHRGSDFVVVHVVDSPKAPRLSPLTFGFHESPHATAFGKAGLASLLPEEQEEYLGAGPLRAHTDRTLTDPVALRAQLVEIAERGIAWEHQEFVPGTSCLAATIKADDGMLVGTVAVSAPVAAYEGRMRHVEDRVRACASRAGRAYRGGPQQH